MAGRTVSKWVRFVLGDSAGTLREIPIWSISVVGVKYDQIELTAFQDAVKGLLPGFPDAPIEITGPFDTTAAAAAAGTGATPVLSGSHTVLSALNGGNTPRSLGVYFGDRALWATGAPTFGIINSATSGYLVFEYSVVPKDPLSYKATLRLFPGSALPAWATTVIT